MADINLGKYDPNSPQFKRVGLFDNPGDSLQRLIDHEIAGLDGTQHTNFDAIVKKYPNMSKEIITSLVKRGITPETPGIGSVASIDGVNQFISAATAVKKLPSMANNDKSLLGKVSDSIYGVAKGITRVGFAALRSPYDYVTTVGRDAYAITQGEKGAGGAFIKDINPATMLTGKTSTLGALAQDTFNGGGVSTGSGFFISPESRVGKEQARAMQAFGRVNGKSFTIGRAAMKTVGADPNSTLYKVTSGIVDATLNVALDPSTWLGPGALTKVARGGKKAAEMKTIAQQEKEFLQYQADVADLALTPTEKELLAQRQDAVGNITRVYDNHYMKAEENLQKASQPKIVKEEKTAEQKVAGLLELLKVNLPTVTGKGAPKVALPDADVNKVIMDSIRFGTQKDIVDNLAQLSADDKNLLNSFDGIFVNELPTADAITFGASGANEFVLKKGIAKDYKIVDLAEDFTDIAGDTKRAAKEINRRLALHNGIKELVDNFALFDNESAILKQLDTQSFVDDLLQGSGEQNLATFLNTLHSLSMASDKNGGAMAQVMSLVSKIWKVDGFSNIRAIHGGQGGIVLKPSTLTGRAVDASSVLAKSMDPAQTAQAMLDVEKVIQPAEDVIAKAQAALDEAKVGREGLDRKLKEIKALRDYAKKDPELIAKIMNNPEYTELGNVMDLELQIGQSKAMKEYIRADAGLIDGIGGSLATNTIKANEYLLGKRFAVVARIIANETSPSKISRLFNNKLDLDLVRQLSDAPTSDDVLRILRENLASPISDPITARSMLLKAQAGLEVAQPMIKLSAPVSQKMLSIVEKMEKALSTYAVRSAVLPLDDLDRLGTGLRDWMNSAKVPLPIIDETIDTLIKAEATTTRGVRTVRSKIIEDAFAKAQVAIVNEHAAGSPELLEILQNNLKIAGDSKALLTEYANAKLAKGELPGIMIQDGKIVDQTGAVYVHQFLDDVVRLPDTRPIVKAIAKYKKNGPAVGTRAALDVFNNDIGEIWRTAQLAFRVSYIVRNIGEMQIRQYLSGHETLLNHPMGYIAMMIANPNGNAMQRLASHFAKYQNDVFSNSFRDPQAAKLSTTAVDEHMKFMSRMVSAGDPSSSDIRVRLTGKIYKVIGSNDPNYHEGLATMLSRFDVDDMMQLVAKADTPELQNALVKNLMNNTPITINNVDRTDIIKEILDASRITRGNRKVSEFDEIFLVDPKLGFTYDNLNELGIRNWLFDANSSGSYQTALNNLMGSGEKGMYIRKLLADGVVTVPGKKGKTEIIRMPRYRDMNKYEDMDAADKAFKSQLRQHFTTEEMPNASTLYADTKTFLEQEKFQMKKWVDSFFQLSAKFENLINFGPEYRMTYWDHIGRYAYGLSLEDLKKLQKSAFETLVGIKVHKPNGSVIAFGKKHPTLSIINKEIKKREKNPIEGTMTLMDAHELSAIKASKHIKNLFYDAGRQLDVANKMRLVFPFIQAHFNTLQKWGELTVQNPVKVIRFGKAYDALTKPGSAALYDITGTKYNEGEGFFYKDEFGQQRFRYPMTGLFGAFAGIASGQKIPAQALQLTAPVQSLNLAFGSVNPGWPGMGPAAQIAYAATGRSQAFGPMWDIGRNLIFPFGEPQDGMLTAALPAWLNKSFLYLTNNQTLVERNVKNWAGYLASSGNYGDNPYGNDAARTKLFQDAEGMSRWVGFATSLFQSIAPATPSQEVLARVKTTENKYNFISMTQLYKAWSDISNANPGNYDEAIQQFADKFGMNNIMPVISGSTKSVTGTTDAWAFLNKNPDIVGKYAVKDSDIVPYFFPGGEAAVSYYNWQVATGRREKLSTEEIASAAEDLVYNMELSKIVQDQIDGNYSNVWYSEQVIALNDRYGGKPVSTVLVGRQEARAKGIGEALKNDAFKMSPVYSETKQFFDAYNNAISHLQDTRVTPEPDLGSSFWLNTKYRNELTDLGTQLMIQNPQFSRMYYSVFANLLKAKA